VQGELTDTLIDLERRRRDGSFPRFARVLVETTGLADPVPILQSLLGDDEVAVHYRIGLVTTVVDAVNGLLQLRETFEAPKQLAVADRIVLSKVDLADADDVARLEGQLRALNPSAAVWRLVKGEGILELWMHDASDAMKSSVGVAVPKGADDRSPGFQHGDVRTFAITWPEPTSIDGLHTWLHLLASFKGPDLLRVKGIVNVEGRPIVINAVQRLIHEPIELERWPSSDTNSNIVFITRGIDRREIEPTLAALSYRRAPSGAMLDPERYANFVNIVQQCRRNSEAEDVASSARRSK
jgi:G3E family GTPase